MNAELDNKTALIELNKNLEANEIKQLLAFAVGYEAGKLSHSLDVASIQCQQEH